ncbi:hypothetical protein, partial [Pseudomonas viridiflava]|uniref:hypothetical protein n=1 Tax=Pseudomonas viridiflava TaxID=33069 RepID=UPI00197FAD58
FKAMHDTVPRAVSKWRRTGGILPISRAFGTDSCRNILLLGAERTSFCGSGFSRDALDLVVSRNRG